MNHKIKDFPLLARNAKVPSPLPKILKLLKWRMQARPQLSINNHRLRLVQTQRQQSTAAVKGVKLLKEAKLVLQ
jgi:hypothetical protein